MKKLIVILVALFSLSFVMASSVMADTSTPQATPTCVTVSQYGGASQIVCGAEHKPVETGLADVNPLFLASIFFTLAGVTFSQYKKLVRSEVGL